ncbi:MAG TPA: MinD/ParA family protein [Spongiibacteraceae bacterium]|nr:MinD/ParA family protein [Spongiibacteraceae bacterium]
MPAAPEQLPKSKRDLPHVIAITSGKGGVGKSSIAVNLGISLAKTGARVCIFDADTGLANINILLGLTPKASLEHVLFGAKSIEDIMLDGPCGLKIIPGANGISECVSLHPRQQLRLTRELARIEGEFDYLLLDTAAGIADNTLDFVGSAHQSVIVITPEPTSLTDAFSLVKVMHRRRPGMIYQVVVNMCSNVAQAREVYHRFSTAVERYIGAQTHNLGYLLRDESMRVAVTLQSPVALFPETDPSSRSFIRLADALKKSVDAQPGSMGFSLFWQRQFRQQNTRERKPAAVVAAGNERAYIGELKSRLLTLIAKDEAPRDDIAHLLAEVARAYSDRFGSPAVDVLTTVDALLSAPQRNEELLGALASKLQPWFAEQQPASTGSVQSVDNFVAEPAVVVATKPPITPQKPVTRPRAHTIHHYDERRFGNQTMLLELLQRQSQSGKTALELINILVS